MKTAPFLNETVGHTETIEFWELWGQLRVSGSFFDKITIPEKLSCIYPLGITKYWFSSRKTTIDRSNSKTWDWKDWIWDGLRTLKKWSPERQIPLNLDHIIRTICYTAQNSFHTSKNKDLSWIKFPHVCNSPYLMNIFQFWHPPPENEQIDPIVRIFVNN
jgi:hypothetical protein